MGGKGHGAPEQFLPYYLQGMIPLSYQLDDDANLAALRDNYVEYILSHQHGGGGSGGNGTAAAWLGPEVTSPRNYWSKYDMIEA